MLIYDIEIEKGILNKRDIPLEGIEYCAGWNDHENMGISVVCAYDYCEDRYRVFTKDDLGDFLTLVNKHNMAVGFNNISFDNAVLACHDVEIREEQCFDILREVWKAAGLGTTFQFHTHVGYSLDACIKANFPSYGKTGHGAMAPVDWQQGRIGSVIDYCLADVWLTKKLMDRIIKHGTIRNPKDPSMYLNITWR